MKLRNKLLALSISSTAVLTTAVAFLSHVIPMFTPAFEEVNNGVSNLPLSMKFVSSTHMFWWAFPLATLSLGFYIFKNESFSMEYQSTLIRIFWGGFILALFLLFFTNYSVSAAIDIINYRVNNP